MPDAQRMPVVGGARHGQVLAVDGRTSAYRVMEPHGCLLLVRRYVFMMPGRTDWQCFPMLTANYEPDLAEATDAVLTAWAVGWSPPDETSIERDGSPADA